MDKRFLDELGEGDPVSVALRGGAGWLHGTVVWRREDVMLIKTDDASMRDTPYVVVLIANVAAIAMPRELAPVTPEPRAAGFMR